MLTGEIPDAGNEIMVCLYDPNLREMTSRGEVDIAALNHLLDLIREAGLSAKPVPNADRFVDLSYGHAAGIQ